MVVNLSDIHVRQYTLNKDLLQLQSVLVDKLRLGIFIADNYDPNVYSEKGFRFSFHNYRSYLLFKYGENDVRSILKS